MGTIFASWAGLNAIASGGANFSLQFGTTPSTGSITIHTIKKNFIPPIFGDLILSDGTRRIRIVNVFRNDYRENKKENIFTISLKDSRWLWKFAEPLTNEFNRNDRSAGDLQTENNVVVATARGIMQILFDQIPSVRNLDISIVPNNIFPYKRYIFVRPSEAIQELLDQFGLAVAFEPNGAVKVVKIGTGDSFPPVGATAINRLRSSEEGALFPEIPEKVRVYGGPDVYQTTETLTPVGLEREIKGGVETGKILIKPLKDLSYAPDPTDAFGGFGESYLAFHRGITNKKDRKFAEDFVFKLFKLNDLFPINQKIVDTEEIAATLDQDTTVIRLDPFILETGHEFQDDVTGWLLVDNRRVTDGFSIDAKRGFVLFNEFKQNSDSTGVGKKTITPATVKLVFSFSAGAKNHRVAKEVYFSIDNLTKVPTGDRLIAGTVLPVSVPELVRHFTIAEGAEIGASIQVSGEQEELLKYADDVIFQVITDITRDNRNRSGEIIGLFEIAAQGRRFNITWTVNSSGAFTSFDWNTESPTLARPPYRQQVRVQDSLRETKKGKDRERVERVRGVIDA